METIYFVSFVTAELAVALTFLLPMILVTLCSRERSSASVTWGPEALIRRSARRSEAARPSRGVLRPEKGSARWKRDSVSATWATRLHIALRLLEEAADVLKEERQAERCPGKGLSCN
ncbi:hypothetical protein NDU88_002686 [Pleurodeles waltl]|uniref:Uncharacterized protein n=1 Tax=Pleurodeles waltl TaxID=8319 RepID=A0AAV7NG32_PLEWA|nr:hypothetical protein NDU88_002686 [Pleurodeles waltl]